MYLGQYDSAFFYFKKSIDGEHNPPQHSAMLVFGLPPFALVALDAIAGIYWINGYEEEAEYYFNEQIKISSRIIDMGRKPPYSPYYDLASVYAFKGEKEKAYEYLRLLNQQFKGQLLIVTAINNEFLFDSIRDEPEFQQIVREMETKYQAEHERVRHWLEENDML